MNARDLMRYAIHPRVIGGALVVSLSLLCGTFAFLNILRPERNSEAPPTAVLSVILMPTTTPQVMTPTPDPLVTPTLPVPPPPPPGAIGIGAFVQVSGTGGDGLRLRSQPALSGEILFLGLESEIFRVDDGPQQADGYTWWYLVAPYDANVNGWAVANFMVAVQNP